MKRFEKKIQEQAKKKYEETVGRPAMSNNRSPDEEQLNKSDKFHTDKELAKLAGVGTGTIARFNRVMSSDKMHGSVKNEEIKNSAENLIYVVGQTDKANYKRMGGIYYRKHKSKTSKDLQI